jgi:tRNA(fMet)-specific endonuclease VapC
MKYLLDTNVCIKILKGNSEYLHGRIKSIKNEEICIPSVVRYELLYGAYKST